MKNREKHICMLYLVCLLTASTSAQSYQWSISSGGTLVDAAYSVAVDSLGNVYATGAFTGTVDFDPGPGIFNLIAAGETDIFVLKLDAAGNFGVGEENGRPIF